MLLRQFRQHACMLLVTLMRCVTGGPPGNSAVPLAGDNLSCMNFGTAACACPIAFVQCAPVTAVRASTLVYRLQHSSRQSDVH